MSVVADRDVMVPMRDGVSLATDVYRPSDDGRHPALLYRTPYNKSGGSVAPTSAAGGSTVDRTDAVERHGYVMVTQDTRGRYRSEGSFLPFFAHESQDGFDTVEWIAAQPWCDGNVGVYGSSGPAATAIHCAVSNPPHLRAAFAYSGGSNLHDGWIYHDGVLELGFVMHWSLFPMRVDEGITRLNVPPTERKALLTQLTDGQTHRWDTMRFLALSDVPAFAHAAAPYWKEWLSHPRYDDYWKAVDAARQAPALKVPLLHGTGWYDIFLNGHLALNRGMKESDPVVRSHNRFFIGPWEHASYYAASYKERVFRFLDASLWPGLSRENTAAAGERDFGPSAQSGAAIMPNLFFSWFGHWLKGEDSSAQNAPVRYFMMGLNEWRESEAWPPPHRTVRYHLHSNGHANTRTGDGTLSEAPPSAGEPSDSFTYDPHDPVPTVGGRSLHPEWGPGGVWDQAEVETRADVLVYSSERLARPLSIAGNVIAAIQLRTSAEDTDVTAKLVDVEPDGYCAIVADGIVRGRYRNGSDHEEWIGSGTVAEFRVDLWDVAHTFRAGHRVRLEVSSSNFPRFDRNLNSRVSPEQGGEQDIRTAVNTVRHDREHASYLELPVIDA